MANIINDHSVAINNDFNIRAVELCDNKSTRNDCIWQSVLYSKDVRGKLKEWNIKVLTYKDFSVINILI
jgi:undecaprenyl pyrophosphate synthase